jgi:hypothetical protein
MERADNNAAAELKARYDYADEDLRKHEARIRRDAERIYPTERPIGMNPFNDFNW